VLVEDHLWRLLELYLAVPVEVKVPDQEVYFAGSMRGDRKPVIPTMGNVVNG
jgi:hypothetical protein